MTPQTFPDTAPPQTAKDVWAEGEFTEPVWFRKAPLDADYYPEHLVVLVHGVRSHWKTWGRLPEYLLEREGVEFDFISYSYPSGNFEAASYKDAAEQLYTKLTAAEFQNYRHISFIVHSTGGLVVKQALLKNRRAIEAAIRKGEVDPLDRECLVFRVRRIINFGVPHRGGSWLGWLVFTALSPFLFPAWTLLHFRNKPIGLVEATQGYPGGYNLIAPQLTWWWRDLVKLEKNFNGFMKELDRRGLSRPVSSDYIGNNDQAIAKAYEAQGDDILRPSTNSAEGWRRDSRVVIVRGTHCRARMPDGLRDFKMDVIHNELLGLFDEKMMKQVGQARGNGCQELDLLTRRTLLTVMDRTSVHVGRIERSFDIVSMIGNEKSRPSGYQKDERRSVEDSWLGSQVEVLNQLHELCAARQSGQFVVTGLAGVGKSSVLRRLAARLCSQHLAGQCQCGYPLYMPLFRYGERSADHAVLLTSGLHWAEFSGWWCAFANDENIAAAKDHHWDVEKRSQIPEVTSGWLKTLLRHGPTVVILDGVDDFLVRNAYLGLSAINTLLQELRTQTQGSGCEILLGVRSSLALPEFMRQGGVVEIGRLTLQQAEQLVENLRDQAVPWGRLISRVIRRVARHYSACSDRQRKLIRDRLVAAGRSLKGSQRSWRSQQEAFLEQISGRLDRDIRNRLAEQHERTFPDEPPPALFSIIESLDKPLVEISVRALLDRIKNPQARKLVLSPLILAKLIRGDRFEELETPAQIFETTLSIVIEESRLNDSGISTGRWLDALTLVGQLFFVRFWPASDFASILAGCQELYRGWVAHQGAHPHPMLQSMLEGFSLATQEETLQLLLRRTVFLAVSSVRLEHREWEEFLAARHLRSAIQFGYVGGMCGRGSWTRMHFLIGDMLPGGGGGEFTGGLIDEIFARAQTMGLGQPGRFLAQVPIGNLLGVIGHSAMALRPSTLDKLFDQYLGRPEAEVPPLVELVALNTIGFRSLREHSEDTYWRQNTVRLLTCLRKVYFPPNAPPRRNSLIVLLAWMLGKALSAKLGESWDFPSPQFDLSRQDSPALADALIFTAHQENGKWSCNQLDETMQRIFINLLPEMAEEGHDSKTIACVTYLPTLIAVALNGLDVAEVSAGLRVFLGNVSKARQLSPGLVAPTPEAKQLLDTVRKFSASLKLAELAELWEDCRNLYLLQFQPQVTN